MHVEALRPTLGNEALFPRGAPDDDDLVLPASSGEADPSARRLRIFAMLPLRDDYSESVFDGAMSTSTRA